MNEPLTPELQRAKIIAELMAMPGPKPLKPIPAEIMSEIMSQQLPYDEAVREYKELMEQGGFRLEPYLEEFNQMLAKKK